MKFATSLLVSLTKGSAKQISETNYKPKYLEPDQTKLFSQNLFLIHLSRDSGNDFQFLKIALVPGHYLFLLYAFTNVVSSCFWN